MASKYLIGRGELLTYPIDAPGGFGEKQHIYTLHEAIDRLSPKIDKTIDIFSSLAASGCPQDMAVAKITLHPSYIAKSFFPEHFLRDARLVSVGSKTVRIKPEKDIRKKVTIQHPRSGFPATPE